jgi:Mor family transcriptional regulator
MSDLANIPDDLIPGIDDLPGDLAQLARTVESVVPGNGVRVVLRIVDEFRGTHIYCRNLDGLKRSVRDRRVIELYSGGMRVPEIARMVGLSERQVWTVLGREPGDERQMSLF